MHKVEYLAGTRVKGAMMNGIMHSWNSHVWSLPNRFVMNLGKGRHQVLIKCSDLGGSAWVFFFRVTDLNGEAVDGLSWLGS
ncbi:MAG: hypothetical protein QGH20_05860 [Candidatus Latescibacteria bacterium]|nr:hypothetical protein [Candidatus Latescibacterota bacterium]